MSVSSIIYMNLNSYFSFSNLPTLALMYLKSHFLSQKEILKTRVYLNVLVQVHFSRREFLICEDAGRLFHPPTVHLLDRGMDCTALLGGGLVWMGREMRIDM